jgi:predicted porin
MKKSLFAAAALTAMAGAAQAQSSVTVYGLLDMGYIGSNSREVATSGAVNKTQKSAFSNGAEQTSRLGFKGTEDLGGGMSAFFTVELGLTPQNSELSGGAPKDAIQSTTNASGSAVDNRQSFVGVKKNGIGQFAFGRQYTTIFNAAAATDPGQLNNVAGNVVYNSGSVYAVDSIGSGTNNNVGFTNRASNTLSAKSDTFAGFSASGFYALNNTNSTIQGGANTTTVTANSAAVTAGGNSNWNGWGLSADYTWQKLYVTAAYQSFKTYYSNNVVSAGTAPINVNSPAATTGQLTAAGTVFNAQNLADKQTYVGGTYDFGILKAYLQWSGRKAQNDTATAAVSAGEQLNRTAQQIGVRSYITPTIEAWGSVGNGKYKGPNVAAAGTTTAAPYVNFVGYQLGANYYLSKRTNLYAIYGQQQSTSSTPATLGSGNSANQYALGLRHTF